MDTFASSFSTSSSVETQTCPKCGTSVPVDKGYVPWCERCEWNLNPRGLSAPQSRLERMYRSLGDRLGRSLRDEVVRSDSLAPKWSVERLLAIVVATPVHALTLALTVAGALVVVMNWPYIFVMALGAMLLGMAWLLRPRLGKPPKEILSRDAAPGLYRLADRIADALQAPKVDGIVLDTAFNAGYAQLGLRRRRVLFLGLPLLAVLDGQELTALMGHEMAHSVNGDPARSAYIGSAIDALNEWYGLLWGLSHWESDGGGLIGFFVLIFMYLARIAAWLLAFLPLGVSYLLAHLLWRDSQRAEYQADRLGAVVGGTRASLSVLGKLQLNTSFEIVLQRAALAPKKQPVSLFSEFRAKIDQLPPRELRRLWLATKSEQSRLDATHPPTGHRADFLEAHPVSAPKVVCSASERAVIMREMEPIERDMQQTLVDHYLTYIS